MSVFGARAEWQLKAAEEDETELLKLKKVQLNTNCSKMSE